MIDPVLGGGQDTLAGCIGSLLGDTTIAVSAPGLFRTLLIAGFPHFVGCLEVRVASATPGDFPAQVLSYPNLVLRDTSYHDTLHVTIRLP